MSDAPARLRTGRKVGRTIYEQVGDEPSDDDRLIGMMDTPELAADVVTAYNQIFRYRRARGAISVPPGTEPPEVRTARSRGRDLPSADIGALARARAQICDVPDWHRVVRVTYEGTARFWYDDGRPAWELPGIEEKT